eukprot:scaffold3972_cov95-Isochrysis_galbana.AAC.3
MDYICYAAPEGYKSGRPEQTGALATSAPAARAGGSLQLTRTPLRVYPPRSQAHNRPRWQCTGGRSPAAARPVIGGVGRSRLDGATASCAGRGGHPGDTCGEGTGNADHAHGRGGGGLKGLGDRWGRRGSAADPSSPTPRARATV